MTRIDLGGLSRFSSGGSALASCVTAAFVVGPWLAALCWTVLVLRSETHWWAIYTVRENGPVELLTFALLTAASALAAAAAWRERRTGGSPAAVAFHAVFAALALVVGMEEVAWGQHVFGFETPEVLAKRNMQNETTLHNLSGVHGNGGKFYVTFVTAALIGTLRTNPLLPGTWPLIRAPRVIRSLLIVILVIGLAKLYTEHVTVFEHYRRSIRWSTEVAEFFIAFVAAFYAASHAARRITALARWV